MQGFHWIGMDMIDRRFENSPEEPEVSVTLKCGYSARFWLTGLTNKEYVKRTRAMKREEKNRRRQGFEDC